MGHLAVMLEREGIQFREFNQARALTGRLADINDKFIRKILEKANLGFIQNDDHIWIALNHDWRKEYMDRLRNTMMQAIEQGVDGKGTFYDFISEAAWQIKMFLFRKGMFKTDPAQTQEITRQIEARANNINKVPQPYREYFINKFREAYLGHEMEGRLFNSHFNFLIEAEADEKCYERLMGLMRSYEAAEMEYEMTDGFYDLYFRYGQVYGKDYSLNLAEQLSADNTRKAIKAWPADTRDKLIEAIWSVASGLLERDQTLDANKLVTAITGAIDHPNVRSLLEKYGDIKRITRQIAEAIVEIAGYSGKSENAIKVAKYLLELSEKEIESTLYELHDGVKDVNWSKFESAS